VPDVTGPTFPPQVIGAWLQQNLATTAANVNLFTQVTVGPDDVVGYTFNDAQGQTCVGFAQTTAITSTVWNADYRCNLPGTPVIVGPALFALTNGEFYVVIYGYIDAQLGANAFAVEFPSGNSANGLLTRNGFIALQQGLEMPLRLIVIDQGGNQVVSPIPIQ
jgi:hypothetical protein